MILSNAKKLIIGVVALVGISLLAAQETPPTPPPPAKPQKVAQNQAELNLIQAVAKATDPATKLAALQDWTKQFPQTQFADERLLEYLDAYQKLGKPREATETALEILKTQPKSVAAYSAILGAIYQFQPPKNPPSPSDLQTADRIVHHILDHLDEIYAADNKPDGMTDAAWAQVKPQMKGFGQRTLGYIAMTAGDNPKAEAELIKTLQLDPTQAVASLWLANVMFAQRAEAPKKQEGAIFEYARVAVYDGPGALDPANRDNAKKRFDSFYKQYHGSMEGAQDVLSLAKTNALPPADWPGIKDIGTITHDRLVEEQKKRDADPMMALWGDVKKNLQEKGEAYFNSDVKDAALPPFKGKLVSHKPPVGRPKELLLAVQSEEGDLTVKLEEGQALPGKMEPGGEIKVEGCVGTAFTANPYMLTITCDKAKIAGWTGKATPTGNAGKGKSTKKG